MREEESTVHKARSRSISRCVPISFNVVCADETVLFFVISGARNTAYGVFRLHAGVQDGGRRSSLPEILIPCARALTAATRCTLSYICAELTVLPTYIYRAEGSTERTGVGIAARLPPLERSSPCRKPRARDDVPKPVRARSPRCTMRTMTGISRERRGNGRDPARLRSRRNLCPRAFSIRRHGRGQRDCHTPSLYFPTNLSRASVSDSPRKEKCIAQSISSSDTCFVDPLACRLAAGDVSSFGNV